MGAMSQLSAKNRENLACLSTSGSAETPWCFAGVLDQLEDAVIVIDSDSEGIPYCNESARQTITSLGVEMQFASLQSFFAAKHISIPPATSSEGSHSIIHNDRIISLSQKMLGGHFICLQIRDVTERKRLESIAQTINTMDNLGFIFSGIRHEIGNPLNSIKMTNSVLQRNLERFSREDISRYIDRTASEISRMEYLLKSLKNFSMYEKTDIDRHDLREFLETTLNLVEPDLEKRGIKVTSELPDSETLVDIDPRALHQAILNIVTNAADALINVSDAAIDITTRANGRLAWIIINDNGCGMTQEQMKRLFQPFNTNKPHGNGLGLVITQKLLTMMQATLDISSNPGRGTKVKIGLPLATPAEDKRT